MDKKEIAVIKNKIEKYNFELKDLEKQIRRYQDDIDSPAEIAKRGIQQFEIANLVRLGVIKQVSTPDAYLQPSDLNRNSLSNAKIKIRNKEHHVITHLGELFMTLCSEKQKRAVS